MSSDDAKEKFVYHFVRVDEGHESRSLRPGVISGPCAYAIIEPALQRSVPLQRLDSC